MKQIVIMPGGFHPFHAGHYALYKSAKKAFPNADLYVAASDDQSERPFPFAYKEKLATLSGVEPGHFIKVKSPFRAQEITSKYNPNSDVLIFVRSEKDKTEEPKPGGTKKDGTPAYFQPWTGKNPQPFSKHAYMAYLPTVEFGPGITSATQIRNAWPMLDNKGKTELVSSLYPKIANSEKYQNTVIKMFDQIMGSNKKVNKNMSEELKSLYSKIKPLIETSTEEQQEKLLELLEAAKKKFEAVNPAQQAAIAINMKKQGKKPKNVSESEEADWDDEEFLEKSVYSRIAKSVFSKLYPDAKVVVSGDDDGDGSFNIETQDGEFGLIVSTSKQEGQIVLFIESAWAGEYKGVTGQIVGLLFGAAKKIWGNPPEGIHLVPNDDLSQGYWQQLAQKLGVKYSPNNVYGERPVYESNDYLPEK